MRTLYFLFKFSVNLKLLLKQLLIFLNTGTNVF